MNASFVFSRTIDKPTLQMRLVPFVSMPSQLPPFLNGHMCSKLRVVYRTLLNSNLYVNCRRSPGVSSLLVEGPLFFFKTEVRERVKEGGSCLTVTSAIPARAPLNPTSMEPMCSNFMGSTQRGARVDWHAHKKSKKWNDALVPPNHPMIGELRDWHAGYVFLRWTWVRSNAFEC